MKFSNLLSKSVISLYNGSNEGIVISGHFDSRLKRITSLEVASQDDANILDEYVLSVKNIYKIGEDAVVIKNNTQLDLKSNTITNEDSPINYYAYNTSGKLLGKITDIEFNERYEIEAFLIDETKIDANRIASFSKGTIVFYEENAKIKVDRFRPTSAKVIKRESEKLTNNLPTTYILPVYENTELNETQEETSETNKDEIQTNIQRFEIENTPKQAKNPINARIERLSGNSNLLIGKRITKTISTPNGELIGKKGNIVTSKTIYLATAHQKLRELVLYCE